MKRLRELLHRIVDRVNINLRRPYFDVGPYVCQIVPEDQFARFYAFYGLTPHHPLYFRFTRSSLAGSYFLGRCEVDCSLLYKSDIRGDELKNRGEKFRCCEGQEIPLHDDEIIRIQNSYLIKTLVHSNSHDPESPEEFLIHNTVSLHYANIHGSRMEGGFLGPFATVDLTSVRNCALGAYAYVQTGEVSHQRVENGQIWIRSDNAFNFHYQFNPEELQRYIDFKPGQVPTGLFMDFVEKRKPDFESAFAMVQARHTMPVEAGASLSRYAVVRGQNYIGENVLVAQRAYLHNAWLGKGSNAQENCYIIASHLEGNNITAHGGKVIHARLGEKVFVGFNSFLHGREEAPLVVGEGSIVMPHTIVDLEEPLEIPPRQLIWGLIRNRRDLERHSLSLDKLAQSQGEIELGAMIFTGNGGDFVEAFEHRIEHILEANGAYFDGQKLRGHAQKAQKISFNIVQPYSEGDIKGLYPTMEIRP